MGASLRDRASRATHGAASRLRHPATIACAYLSLALFTFGHSASQAYADMSNSHYGCHVSPSNCAGGAAIRGFFAGALWPLYWSWEAQQ
jgi:hypothetical protein